MSSRINLGDLKSQIAKRVGPDRAQQYFGYLSKFLSRKLGKAEFNKLCVSVLGRENLHLHNQLIRSVFRNACQAKTPPESKKAQQPPVLSNGDVLSRSLIAGRRVKDRPSPLGPNGRAVAHYDETVRENGVTSSCDLKRPMLYHEGAPAEPLMKKPRRDFVQAERNDSSLAKVPLQAPLGIPFCAPSPGGARKGLVTATSSFSYSGGCSDSGELMQNEDLRRRMERIAEEQGLGGIAPNCANLLNDGLDAYLKVLIKSSLDLVRTRSGLGQMKQQAYKHQIHGKPINGVWQGNHVPLQGGGTPLEGSSDQIDRRQITIQDFRVAMEMNPQQLGENWPLLLEKICHSSFKE